MLFWFVPAGACTRSDRGPVDRTGLYAAVRFGQAIGAREEAHRSRANARERPRPKRVGRLEPCFDRLRFVTSAFRGPAYPTRRTTGGAVVRATSRERTPPAKRAAAPVWRMRAPISADPPVRGVRSAGGVVNDTALYAGFYGGSVRCHRRSEQRCPLRRDVRRHGDAILKRTIS